MSDPASSPDSPATSGSDAWWWRLDSADGAEVPPPGGRQEFPTRSDAESYVGEAYAELAARGIASVTLFEGEREVYGPMSLSPG